MRLLILVLMVTIVQNISCQNSQKLVYEYYSTGEVKEQYPIVEGKINGEFILFRKDGTIKEKYNIKNNIPYGTISAYDREGKLSEEYAFDFKRNFKEDLATEYHVNGQIKAIGFYVNGEKSGLWKEYLNNAESYSKFEYRNGAKDGIYEYIYLGTIVTKGAFEGGCPSGIWYF